MMLRPDDRFLAMSGFSLGFERLMEEITEGISLTDPNQPDNPLVYVNSAFCRLTGYGADEVLGRNCRFLQGEGTDREQIDILRTALELARPCIVELRNYRRDGSSFWNSLSVSPVTDEEGQLRYFIGVQTDITRRRQLEERQRQFIGDMAHELKTPLAAILGLTDTLSRQPEMGAEIRHDFYNSLLRQSERLHQTVNDILDLSRINSLATINHMQRMDLGELLTECVSNFQAQAGLSDISLEVTMADRSYLLMGDPWSLSALISNLISNALKYSPPGSTIHISLDHGADGMHTLEVADMGPGITPEHQQHIFERFYRVEPDRSRAKGGTGLGLAIAQEVATRHRGHILLSSEPGKGSTFTVKLPPCS